MSLRVIAGSAKGRRLKLVPGDSTRPIMDRVKEALFSILGQDIWDSCWLDLFAGTGSVGIEALSRGAEHTIFIDLNRQAIKTIQENLTATGLQARATVRQADAFSLLKAKPERAYDYIYIAPPQYQGLWKQALTMLDKSPTWLQNAPIVIVQIDPNEREELALTHLEPYDERRYGKTLLWFFTTSSPQEAKETTA